VATVVQAPRLASRDRRSLTQAVAVVVLIVGKRLAPAAQVVAAQVASAVL
jgi:hypothetical protein